MTKNAKSVDGFIVRRDAAAGRDIGHVFLDADAKSSAPRPKAIAHATQPRSAKAAKSDDDLTADIAASLQNLGTDNDILAQPPAETKAAKRFRAQKSQSTETLPGKKRHPVRRIIKWFIITILVLAVAVAGFLLVKSLLTGGKIFHGNVFDIITSKTRLAEDGDGRTNVLVFGTSGYGMSEDAWDGAFLTDSIMVLSVDQDTRDAYMISLPRDLYVKHTCKALGTTSGKLNESYFCGYSDHGDNEEAGAAELRQAVGNILGLNIQYYVHADWTALVQAVNAVGGVDVTIESSDPRGIYDIATGVKYANGATAHLDGEAALALTRARNSEGGYGLSGGNFDREKNQQKVLVALQAKALSVGTLANPAAVSSLLDALGDNLRTNFKTSEVQTLIDLAKNIKSGNIASLPLVGRADNAPDLVATDMVNNASVVVPTAGTYNYSQIQVYVAQNLSSDPVVREAAVIDVLNGSDTAGLAQRQADALVKLNYNIGSVANAPDVIADKVQIYQLDSAKTATAAALAKRFGASVQTGAPSGYTSPDNADFVLIVGAAIENN